MSKNSGLNMVLRLTKTFPSAQSSSKLTKVFREEQERYFTELVTNGTATCRITGVRESVFIRAFNKEMVAFLQNGYRLERKNGGAPFCTRDLAPKGATKASSDGTYCVYLDLLKVVYKKGRHTYYNLTQRGVDAVKGRAPVPTEFVVFRGKFIAESRNKAPLKDLKDVSGSRRPLKKKVPRVSKKQRVYDGD